MLFSAAVAWQLAFALETEALSAAERLESVVQLLMWGLLAALIAISATMGIHLSRVRQARRRLMLHIALRHLGVRRASSRARIVAAATWSMSTWWLLPVAFFLAPFILMGVWSDVAAMYFS
jgi:type II secretory pathway pseudopilin PulG